MAFVPMNGGRGTQDSPYKCWIGNAHESVSALDGKYFTYGAYIEINAISESWGFAQVSNISGNADYLTLSDGTLKGYINQSSGDIQIVIHIMDMEEVFYETITLHASPSFISPTITNTSFVGVMSGSALWFGIDIAVYRSVPVTITLGVLDLLKAMGSQYTSLNFLTISGQQKNGTFGNDYGSSIAFVSGVDLYKSSPSSYTSTGTYEYYRQQGNGLTLTLSGQGTSIPVYVDFRITVTDPCLTYDTHGGTFTSTPTVNYYTYGTQVTLATDISRSGYEFVGWKLNGTGSYITSIVMDGDKEVVANWEKLYTYSIYFNANGGTGAPQDVIVTTTDTHPRILIPSTRPTRTGCSFAGWSTTQSNPDEGTVMYRPGDRVEFNGPFNNTSKTLYAVWTINKYTVTWKNYDDTVLETDYNVPYGTTPSYDGATPERQSTAQYTYYFTGWSPTTSEVTGDAVYTAQYNSTLRSYRVNIEVDPSGWGALSINGVIATYGTEVTISDNVLTFWGNYSGGAATCVATPINVTGEYVYSFDYWENVPQRITGPTTITAHFKREIRQCKVNFRAVPNEWGSVDKTTITKPYGTSVSESGNTYTVGDTTITATPANDTAQYDYEFDQWVGGPPSYIYSDVTIDADFSRTLRKYTVTWKSQDGQTTLETDSNVPYGTAPSYDGSTPTKATTAQYTFTFAGWATAPNQETGVAVAELPTVSGETTYYAAFSKTVRTYTITWKNYDGTVLETDYGVPYGNIPVYTHNTPTRPATSEKYYTFSGWNPVISSVTGSQIYTAQFTETDVTQYLIENGQLKVFDWEQLEYVLVDDAPFMLTFQPNGGLFTRSVVPQIKVISATYKDPNGHVTNIEIPEAYRGFGSAYYMQLKDGTYAYIWALVLLGCTKVTLEIRDLPAIKNGGITAPPGFDNISAWETNAPYHKFPFSNGSVDYTHTDADDNGGCYQMEIDRITIDNIRQMMAVPYWVPARDGNLRALVVASGLGSLNFGAIQAIETTYNSRLTVIPIVCYGYTGTFCMDLGVSKTVSITYTRVQPSGTATVNGQTVTLPCDPRPDFPVYDSRCWSNAYWIKKLRDFTDRWQLRTNGCTLYLKRPNDPRLTNGYLVDDEPDPDPMRDFVEEINGENCYISSAPVRYVTGCPNVIKNSIKFMMGTLYPKQTPARTIEVEMYWGADTPSYEGEILYTSHPDRTIYFQYPEGTAAVPPKIPYLWAPYYDTTNDTYVYVSRLYYLDNNRRTYLDEVTYFLPTQGMKIYSEVRTPPSNGVKFYTYGSGTVTVKPLSSSAPMIITYYLIGGGGGGGGASCRLKPELSGGISHKSSGGAGGASGEYNTGSSTIAASSDSIRLSYSVGAGGAGGASNYYSEGIIPIGGEVVSGDDGGHGDPTTISFNGITNTALGGHGGPGATGCNNPGVWTNDILPDSPNTGSYRGGNGGENNGSDGFAPSQQTNYGVGGISYDETHLHIGGGGGGGAPIIFNASIIPQGGNGAPTSAGLNGYIGGGGGGGAGGPGGDVESPVRSPGGSGGNGAVYIFVQNGVISDD